MGLPLSNYSPAVAQNKGAVGLKSFTVATAPSAVGLTGSLIFVSNGAAGSAVVAFSDGTNWLRCDTLAAISAT